MDTVSLPARVGLVGGGVIGAGWACRFALWGIDVVVADPSPAAPEVLAEVFDNAVAAWDEMGLERDPPGRIDCVETISEAAADVQFVQESVPEREDLKRAVLVEIERVARADALIASSTSGLRPSILQSGLQRPERLVVGHPFHPVYLLPLVEVVGGEDTSEEAVDRALELYTALGMRPLRVRVEIDAFIADRLMEALWREALWLVHDGVATTGEIDHAMTHGFGLRWAQMGLFDTFRAAGGAGGLRHFLEQFGPTLELPWSRLRDTPELDAELIEMMVEQSDLHSHQLDIHSTERVRDRNLASILMALEANEWGAGRDLAAMRRLLAEHRRVG